MEIAIVAQLTCFDEPASGTMLFNGDPISSLGATGVTPASPVALSPL